MLSRVWVRADVLSFTPLLRIDEYLTLLAVVRCHDGHQAQALCTREAPPRNRERAVLDDNTVMRSRQFVAARRMIEPESLACADPATAARNLRDLARINRWFGGHRTLAHLLSRELNRGERFTVLDVAAASGDMGRCIERRFPNAAVTSLDLKPLHLREAAGSRVAADAFRLPFQARSFDFVLCSSLLHHFPDELVVELIAGIHRLARRALILMDIERHSVAYRFLPWTRRLLGWSDLTVRDGSLSVAAAFGLREFAALVRAAAPGPARVRRHRPWFRLSAVVPATPPPRPRAEAPFPIPACSTPY